MLINKMQKHGYEAHALLEAIELATHAMINNKGDKSNEDCFWEIFPQKLGDRVIADKYLFEEFYREEFQLAKSSCGYNSEASELVSWLKAKGQRLILATNPLFPNIATFHRIHWAGLNPDDFELYTTYENSHFCKPNLNYYLQIMEKIGEVPENCIMVGNDVQDDMAAQELGMRVFLLTDCLINTSGVDISSYPQGGFKELRVFLSSVLGDVSSE